ncbi:MAG: DUF364 domain-containing protein [Candidatus Ozemobacteraceae bacterium]
MKPSVVSSLIERVMPLAQDAVISDVRLGLGYSAIQLDHGGVGVCWSPKSTGHACTVFESAGTLVGRKAAEVIPWLGHTDIPWHRAIGLAALNAVLNHDTPPVAETVDIITQLALQKHDRVAMVGCFRPLLKSIRSNGCHLDIIELEPSIPDSLTPKEGVQALQTCTVAILTGTSLVTGTLDDLLNDISTAREKPRAVVLLGPSVPLIPEAFQGTPITYIAGSWVRDGKRVLQVVSEGGGTPQLKPSLISMTLCVLPTSSHAKV